MEIGIHIGGDVEDRPVTTIQSRGKFVRICVELDLDKPLQPKVIARGYLLIIQYEGLYAICFKCEPYGHRERNCVHGVGTRRLDKVVP